MLISTEKNYKQMAFNSFLVFVVEFNWCLMLYQLSSIARNITSRNLEYSLVNTSLLFVSITVGYWFARYFDCKGVITAGPRVCFLCFFTIGITLVLSSLFVWESLFVIRWLVIVAMVLIMIVLKGAAAVEARRLYNVMGFHFQAAAMSVSVACFYSLFFFPGHSEFPSIGVISNSWLLSFSLILTSLVLLWRFKHRFQKIEAVPDTARVKTQNSNIRRMECYLLYLNYFLANMGIFIFLWFFVIAIGQVHYHLPVELQFWQSTQYSQLFLQTMEVTHSCIIFIFLIAALFSLSLHYWGRWLGYRVTYVLSLILGSTSLLLMSAEDGPIWLILEMLGVGICMGSIFSLPYVLISPKLQRHRLVTGVSSLYSFGLAGKGLVMVLGIWVLFNMVYQYTILLISLGGIFLVAAALIACFIKENEGYV